MPGSIVSQNSRNVFCDDEQQIARCAIMICLPVAEN